MGDRSSTIATLVAQTFRSLQRLTSTIRSEKPLGVDESLINILDGLLGRFNVWADHVSAAQVGTISLEYRLRDSSHICDKIKDLLCDLNDSLKDGKVGGGWS